MEEQSASYTVDDALLSSGFGKFQMLIFSYAGIGLIAEAMEMMLLSFVGPSVQLEWKLTSHQESMITSWNADRSLLMGCGFRQLWKEAGPIFY
jgi:hypothetical protein